MFSRYPRSSTRSAGQCVWCHNLEGCISMASLPTTAELQEEVLQTESKALWIFAYGSLCWKPGFDFHKAVTGHVLGHKRRFWQGNTTHRGTEDRPGRVATLVEDSDGIVHGIAFAISGEAALPYLSHRECTLGGYISKFSTFYPVNGEPFKVLLYVATPLNPHWLGDADIDEIAHQITHSEGNSGHNVEYLMRLATFMREHFPNHYDCHLYSIERKVLSMIESKKLELEKLMGNGEGCITFVKKQDSRGSSPTRQNAATSSFEYVSLVPGKKLRCLNI